MEYLTELQIKYSTSLYLHQGQIMQYLTTEQLTIRNNQLLFKLRSGVTPNLCHILCTNPHSVENLQHTGCPFLTSQPQLSDELQTINCENVYGSLSG